MTPSHCISLSGCSMWALIALDRPYQSHAEPSKTLSGEEQDCLSRHLVHVWLLKLKEQIIKQRVSFCSLVSFILRYM